MANTYETIIIILAISINTGIILWFIANYRDMDFGGNPMLLNINYNKNKMENVSLVMINVLQLVIH